VFRLTQGLHQDSRLTCVQIRAGAHRLSLPSKRLHVNHRRLLRQLEQLPQQQLVGMRVPLVPQIINRKLCENEVRVVVDVLVPAHAHVIRPSCWNGSILDDESASGELGAPPVCKDVDPDFGLLDAVAARDAAAENADLDRFASLCIAQQTLVSGCSAFICSRAGKNAWATMETRVSRASQKYLLRRNAPVFLAVHVVRPTHITERRLANQNRRPG